MLINKHTHKFQIIQSTLFASCTMRCKNFQFQLALENLIRNISNNFNSSSYKSLHLRQHNIGFLGCTKYYTFLAYKILQNTTYKAQLFEWNHFYTQNNSFDWHWYEIKQTKIHVLLYITIIIEHSNFQVYLQNASSLFLL